MGCNVWESSNGNTLAMVNGASGGVDEMLPYDEDWNLLYTVIDKIELLGYRFKLSKDLCQIYNSKNTLIVNYDEYDDFRYNAYYAVCTFINWYNLNK